MARRRWKDPLLANVFYLLDYSIGETSMLAQLVAAGFKSVSMPEMNVTTESIKEGNSPFGRPIITGATCTSVTMTKGVTFFDSDFWRWASRAAVGAKTWGLEIGPLGLKSGIRKDLFLIQFMKGAPLSLSLPFGGWDKQLKVFPAKLWMLEECVPVRYKPGTDLDATTGQVSIAELEVQPVSFDELGVASL